MLNELGVKVCGRTFGPLMNPFMAGYCDSCRLQSCGLLSGQRMCEDKGKGIRRGHDVREVVEWYYKQEC